MRPTRVRVSRTAVPVLLCLALAGAPAAPAVAGAPPVRTLVPIGSDYQADTLWLFARETARHDTSGRVVILVLPITYSLSADSTKNGERSQNLKLADHRRAMIEDACNAVKAPDQVCDAQLMPTLVRADAYLQSNLDFFTPDVDGMYVLGGDQTVAMTLVAGTPLEAKMAEAYAGGGVFGGISAGDAVQSVNMINGYTGSNGAAESMRRGAVDVWSYTGPGDLTRGLIFGLPTAIAEQHVFEYGRTGRALNVAFSSGLPVIGMDAATGAMIRDEARLSDVVGDTSGIVLDTRTWSATGSYGGPNATLSERGTAVHLLPPGGYGYDIPSLRPIVDGGAVAAPSIAGRTYPAFTTPAGAAPLLLAGGIAADPAGAVGQRFLQLAGGVSARVLVLAIGYSKTGDARAAAKAVGAVLQPGVTAPVAWASLDDQTETGLAASIADATGILLLAPDRSRIGDALGGRAAILDAVRARWSSGGATLLADDAAAAALGAWYVADGISADVEASAPADMLSGGVAFKAGLAWIGGLNVQPRLLPDQGWGQLFRLDGLRPGTLAAGIDVGTAVEVWGGGATARGDSAAVVLDGRHATFGQGANTALAATWITLDSFVAGESLAP